VVVAALGTTAEVTVKADGLAAAEVAETRIAVAQILLELEYNQQD
jgi:hypothetical protein